MKTVKNRRFGLLALLLMSTPFWGMPASARQFEQAEISNPDNFIVVAAPTGRLGYGLVILEQVRNDRPCWDEVETGTGPTLVDPLLTQFDFTGICGRSIDSNSYSLRTGGEDLGLQYSLRVLRQGNDLVLVAAANRQRNVFIPIGRTYGMPQAGEFVQIRLDPGWRLARRTFDGRSTGHLYLTNDQPISVLLAAANSPTSTAGPISPPPLPNPQTPSNSPLLPLPGSTSPLTGSPTPRGTTQPSSPTAPVQIPVPPPESSRASSGSSSGANLGTNPGTNSGSTPPVTPSRATLPPLPNRPSTGAPAVPPPPAPPASTTATGTPPLPTPPARTATGNTAVGTPSSPSVSTPAPAQPIPAPQPEQRQATGIVYGYRVIVAADSAEEQDRVRSLAPQTQIVMINGQPAVQAGLFRDLTSAEQMRQRLVGENLSVTIVPIR